MTSPFSWSDTVKIAFISCFPFLKASDEHEDQLHNPTTNRIPRARPDELQGLLVDDLNSETLSLHSNPGRARNNKKKRAKKHRRITFFGYNLFGRPIQLSDEDDALYYQRDGSLTPNTNTTTHSTSTFDSDAAPLDSDAIAALSSSAAQASVDMETQRLKEKEERRQRRREKKELKHLAESMAVQGIIGDGDVFEGFQGSGGLMAPPLRHSPIPNATSFGSDSGSAQEEFGRFVAAPSQFIPQPEENHDDADLDGGVYAHRKRRVKGSHDGSDSRSRTSTSTADRGPLQDPINPNNDPVQSQPPSSYPQSGRKEMSSRTSATTGSSATSQSPSLHSPVSLAFSNEMVSPSTAEQGQGFFDSENSVNPSFPDIKKPVEGFTTPTLGGKFPMTRFKGLTGVGAKRTGDLGAFLARRGDENKIDGL